MCSCANLDASYSSGDKKRNGSEGGGGGEGKGVGKEAREGE